MPPSSASTLPRSRASEQCVKGRVRGDTAADITELYDRLWWRTPPGRYHVRSERHAQRHRWPEPWQWEGVDLDDPDAAPPPDRDVLDEIAIAEAASGRHVPLTRLERREVQEILEAAGYSAEEIADRVGRSARTVVRRRAQRRSAA